MYSQYSRSTQEYLCVCPLNYFYDAIQTNCFKNTNTKCKCKTQSKYGSRFSLFYLSTPISRTHNSIILFVIIVGKLQKYIIFNTFSTHFFCLKLSEKKLQQEPPCCDTIISTTINWYVVQQQQQNERKGTRFKATTFLRFPHPPPIKTKLPK